MIGIITCNTGLKIFLYTGKNLEFPDFRNSIGQLSAWPVLHISCTRSDDF